MGVTTHDIFDDAEGAQPATPGSYGEPPPGFRLPQATRLGPVRLRVADLGRSVDYYEGTLGLRVLDRSAARAVMGTQVEDVPLVELHERPGARPPSRRGTLGLFHFAILMPDRAALGRFVSHLGEIGAQAGAGDHLVSESFYLQDPDNLGIEVYADRPQATWRRIGRQLMMATDPVDVEGVVRAAGNAPWTGMPPGTRMGHLHLHVGDLATASAFYSDGLGFDRMVWQYPGALFLAADGYHHHLGTNIWAGPAARAPDEDTAQLLEWTVVLPDPGSLEAAAESLAARDTLLNEILPARLSHFGPRIPGAPRSGWHSPDPRGIMTSYTVGYFVGSLSSKSINRLLAKALVLLAPPELQLTEIPFKDLPLYSPDFEADYPPVARALKDAIAAADAVLFITPEYNRSIPGGLKNAIDWASRPYGKNSFARKPSAVIGTSPGAIGTAVAQQHLRSLLSYCNSPQMNAPEAYIQFKPGLITESGEVTNPSTEEFLATYMKEFHAFIVRVYTVLPRNRPEGA